MKVKVVVTVLLSGTCVGLTNTLFVSATSVLYQCVLCKLNENTKGI